MVASAPDGVCSTSNMEVYECNGDERVSSVDKDLLKSSSSRDGSDDSACFLPLPAGKGSCFGLPPAVCLLSVSEVKHALQSLRCPNCEAEHSLTGLVAKSPNGDVGNCGDLVVFGMPPALMTSENSFVLSDIWRPQSEFLPNPTTRTDSHRRTGGRSFMSLEGDMMNNRRQVTRAIDRTKGAADPSTTFAQRSRRERRDWYNLLENLFEQLSSQQTRETETHSQSPRAAGAGTGTATMPGGAHGYVTSMFARSKGPTTQMSREAFMRVFNQVPGVIGERLFAVFDRDLSGYIDFQEFFAGLSILYSADLAAKLSFIFQMYDLNADGFISRDEFAVMLSHIPASLLFLRSSGDAVRRARQLLINGLSPPEKQPNPHQPNLKFYELTRKNSNKRRRTTAVSLVLATGMHDKDHQRAWGVVLGDMTEISPPPALGAWAPESSNGWINSSSFGRSRSGATSGGDRQLTMPSGSSSLGAAAAAQHESEIALQDELELLIDGVVEQAFSVPENRWRQRHPGETLTGEVGLSFDDFCEAVVTFPRMRDVLELFCQESIGPHDFHVSVPLDVLESFRTQSINPPTTTNNTTTGLPSLFETRQPAAAPHLLEDRLGRGGGQLQPFSDSFGGGRRVCSRIGGQRFGPTPPPPPPINQPEAWIVIEGSGCMEPSKSTTDVRCESCNTEFTLRVMSIEKQPGGGSASTTSSGAAPVGLEWTCVSLSSSGADLAEEHPAGGGSSPLVSRFTQQASGGLIYAIRGNGGREYRMGDSVEGGWLSSSRHLGSDETTIGSKQSNKHLQYLLEPRATLSVLLPPATAAAASILLSSPVSGRFGAATGDEQHIMRQREASQLSQQFPCCLPHNGIVDLCGWLQKRGRRTRLLVRRFYVLRNRVLYYYTFPTRVTPNKACLLLGCTVQPEMPTDNCMSDEETQRTQNRAGHRQQTQWQQTTSFEFYPLSVPNKFTHPSGFILSLPNGHQIKLYADSKRDRDTWIAFIENASRTDTGFHDLYTLHEQLGMGKFGRVYRATDKTTNERVAVKILARGTAGLEHGGKGTKKQRGRMMNRLLSVFGKEDKGKGLFPLFAGQRRVESSIGVAEFQRTEVAVLKLLNHPNLVRLLDVHENPKYLYIVMEWGPSGDLRRIINAVNAINLSLENLDQPPREYSDRAIPFLHVPECFIREVTKGVMQGLVYLHSPKRNVIHRDLKPENVLLNMPITKIIRALRDSVGGDLLPNLAVNDDAKKKKNPPGWLPATSPHQKTFNGTAASARKAYVRFKSDVVDIRDHQEQKGEDATGSSAAAEALDKSKTDSSDEKISSSESSVDTLDLYLAENRATQLIEEFRAARGSASLKSLGAAAAAVGDSENNNDDDNDLSVCSSWRSRLSHGGDTRSSRRGSSSSEDDVGESSRTAPHCTYDEFGDMTSDKETARELLNFWVFLHGLLWYNERLATIATDRLGGTVSAETILKTRKHRSDSGDIANTLDESESSFLINVWNLNSADLDALSKVETLRQWSAFLSSPFLNNTLTPKITDFGLSKIIAPPDTPFAASPAVTPAVLAQRHVVPSPNSEDPPPIFEHIKNNQAEKCSSRSSDKLFTTTTNHRATLPLKLITTDGDGRRSLSGNNKTGRGESSRRKSRLAIIRYKDEDPKALSKAAASCNAAKQSKKSKGGAAAMLGYAREALGTLPYLAPEVLFQKKYSTSADMWSAGVAIFQLFALGAFPVFEFRRETNDSLLSEGVAKNIQPTIIEKEGKQEQQTTKREGAWDRIHKTIARRTNSKEEEEEGGGVNNKDISNNTLTAGFPDVADYKDLHLLFQPTGCWKRISQEARHFLQGLLQPDVSRRMTAWQALQHPWLVCDLIPNNA